MTVLFPNQCYNEESYKWTVMFLCIYRDSWGRICCEVVAIDALVIHDYKAQFKPFIVKRELNKVYINYHISF